MKKAIMISVCVSGLLLTNPSQGIVRAQEGGECPYDGTVMYSLVRHSRACPCEAFRIVLRFISRDECEARVIVAGIQGASAGMRVKSLDAR